MYCIYYALELGISTERFGDPLVNIIVTEKLLNFIGFHHVILLLDKDQASTRSPGLAVFHHFF